MLYNAIPNPFLARAGGLSGALVRSRLATDDLWALVDDRVSALPDILTPQATFIFHTSNIEKSCDRIGALQALRSVAAPMRSFFQTLRDERAISVSRNTSFQRSLDGTQHNIDSSAMKYGLDRLPDELELRVFFNVANDMKSTLVLSHVCQRFRSIVNGTPAFWRRFRLSATWGEDQILAIAQRSKFRDLKADIRSNMWHYGIPSSVSAILSLSPHLVELSLGSAHAITLPTYIGRRVHFPKLRMLTYERPEDIASVHLEEIFETPLLQVVKADFIPHISQARSLTVLVLDLRFVRCQLELLIFLSSATALEELSLDTYGAYDEQEMIEQADAYLPKLADLRFKMLVAWNESRLHP